MTAMEYIELPEGVMEIGKQAFQNCKAKNLYLPSTLLSIGTNAFSGWTATQNIYFRMSEVLAMQRFYSII